MIKRGKSLRALVAGVLIVGAVAGCSAATGDVVAQGSTGGNAAGLPEGPALQASLSPDTAKRLEAEGTTFVPLSEKAMPPRVSMAKAHALAAADFGGLLSGAKPAETQYAAVTNSKMGSVPEGGTPQSPEFRRTIEARRMWLVVYRNVKMHIPGGTSADSKEPVYNTTDFVVYVDAETGEMPSAESF